MTRLKYPSALRTALLRIAILIPAWGLAGSVQAAAGEGIEAFPGAQVAYESVSESSRGHSIPVDRIARVDGFMQPRTSREVQGKRRSITWRHARGVTSEAVYEHLRAQLPADVWYECQSRDCGPSTYWAHRHFEVADLYGADGSQFYVAVPRATPEGPVLTMLYVVQRGTREIMAHLEDILLDPGEVTETDPQMLTEALLGTGVARLSVDFTADGEPGPEFSALLDALVEASERLPARSEWWFVVHLRDAGSGSASTLDASERRAQQLAAALAERLPDRTVSGLGVGALIPGVLRDEGVLVQLVLQQPPS
ncbi:MAG: DUF4892 domain-containing protein [Gammaproteobacteria bacterium]|nr:MAG: DUF4892 domain-containing protein [Gammaproteobacteria bacterium]